MLIQNFDLILASNSSIRKTILADVGLKFNVISPTFDEDGCKGKFDFKPQDLALYLAKQKALSISKQYLNSYIIGSDQVCEFEGREVFKSNNFDEAVSQLKSFSGKTHIQNNAAVIAYNNKIIFENITLSKLTLRELSNEEIIKYVELDKSWGCAGSYKYESMAKHLFSKVEGDYYGILGLSIQPILSFLYDKKLLKIA